MSVNKGLTRIDDAVIPDELVRFSQLGGGGGATPKFYVTWTQTGFSTNDIFFCPFNTSSFFSTTEALRNVEIFIDYNVTRVTARVITNTKNGATIVGHRDDGVNAGTLSIPASTTGALDSGALSVSIASGSLVSGIMDTSASSGGTFDVRGVLIECEPT